MFSPSHSPGSMYMFQYCQLLSLTFWMPLYLSSWVYIMDEKKDQNCLCPARYGSSQSCDIAKICHYAIILHTCQLVKIFLGDFACYAILQNLKFAAFLLWCLITAQNFILIHVYSLHIFCTLWHMLKSIRNTHIMLSMPQYIIICGGKKPKIKHYVHICNNATIHNPIGWKKPKIKHYLHICNNMNLFIFCSF